MGSVSIPLHSRKYPGLFALIDEEDYERVSRYRWNPSKHTNGFYAATTVEGRFVSLHVFVFGTPPPGYEVDHENGLTLDCRRSNLRAATHAQNTRNRRKGSSGRNPYKGVHASKKRWRAIVDCDGVRYRSPAYVTPEEAAAAYDRMAVQLFGEFARRNFPDEPIQFALPIRAFRTHAIGVYFDKSRNRWRAEIVRNGVRYRLGSFDTEEAAIEAYQRKRDELAAVAA